MNLDKRSSTAVAVILIALGALFLAINTVPGFSLNRSWPVIPLLIAVGFYVPPLTSPNERKALSALFIPGSVFLVLSVIFFYNTLTEDWESWAYAWTLIPGGVGLGLALAAHFGDWGRGTWWTGIWLAVGSLTAFGFFATLFGGPLLKTLGPAALIGCGVLLLLRAMARPARPA